MNEIYKFHRRFKKRDYFFSSSVLSFHSRILSRLLQNIQANQNSYLSFRQKISSTQQYSTQKHLHKNRTLKYTHLSNTSIHILWNFSSGFFFVSNIDLNVFIASETTTPRQPPCLPLSLVYFIRRLYTFQALIIAFLLCWEKYLIDLANISLTLHVKLF